MTTAGVFVVVAVCPRFPPGDHFALTTWPADVSVNVVCGDRVTFSRRWVTTVAALSVGKPVRSGGGGGGDGRACQVPVDPPHLRSSAPVVLRVHSQQRPVRKGRLSVAFHSPASSAA